MQSTSTPASGRRATIQKRKAALKKPTPQNRLAVQAYMKNWEVAEDEALLAAITKHGARWRLVASEVPGRTEAMCRNRYQRIMAPIKEGRSCTSRNRCTRCGQMKRGHTCRGQGYVEMEQLPSPLAYDSLGLMGDIERPLDLPAHPASPLPLLAGPNPGQVMMAMAAGAWPLCDPSAGMDPSSGGGGEGAATESDLMAVEELDEATEYGEQSTPPSEYGDDALDLEGRPPSAVAVASASSSSSSAYDAECEGEGSGRAAYLPTPVKKGAFAFRFKLDADATSDPCLRRPTPTLPAVPSASTSASSATAAANAPAVECERLCDEEVAAALGIGAELGPSLDPAAIDTALAALAAPAAEAPAPAASAAAGAPPPPPVLSAPSLTVGASFISGLLAGGSFDGVGGGSGLGLPQACRQMSDSLFLRDLMAQRREGGASPTPSLPTLEDPSPPSFGRFVSLGALGF